MQDLKAIQRSELKNVFTTIKKLKVGDVITFPILGTHPLLIIKMADEIAYGVVLSTTIKGLYSLKNDRFMYDSNVTTTIINVPEESARKHYIGSLTILNELPAIKKAVREAIKDILRVRPKKEKQKWVPMDFEMENEFNLGEIS